MKQLTKKAEIRKEVYEKGIEFHDNLLLIENTRKNLEKYYAITNKVDQYIKNSIGFNCRNKNFNVPIFSL